MNDHSNNQKIFAITYLFLISWKNAVWDANDISDPKSDVIYIVYPL